MDFSCDIWQIRCFGHEQPPTSCSLCLWRLMTGWVRVHPELQFQSPPLDAVAELEWKWIDSLSHLPFINSRGLSGSSGLASSDTFLWRVTVQSKVFGNDVQFQHRDWYFCIVILSCARQLLADQYGPCRLNSCSILCDMGKFPRDDHTE